ncbi:hypothetical protein BJV82DRAFT_309153 [Fennellomyces sp. T-0311]|nr:hypothetical protein BJV82DRAFT_309153 [Fennellomyces sp. T-0311]
MKRLLPLLILRIFPQEAYQIVALPRSIRNGVDWRSVGIDADQVKWANDDSKRQELSRALFNELLSRAQDLAEYRENKELAKALLRHMFCAQ